MTPTPKALMARWRGLNGVSLSWRVDNIASVMDDWSAVQVFSAAAKAGPYVALGAPVPLVAGTYEYGYDHAAGTEATWYTAALFAAGPTYGDKVESPVAGSGGGRYVTVEDMRAEGLLLASADNARVRKTITRVEAFIERVCGRRFYAKQETIKLDGNDSDIITHNEPIIAIKSIEFLYEPVVGYPVTNDIDVTAVRVYNRHLTQGMVSPNDRDAPRMVFENYDLSAYAKWWQGNQNVIVGGWFGYTVLDVDDVAGETEAGSQVPVSFGVTPPDIADAAARLVVLWYHQKADTEAAEEALRAGDISSIKTRDQSITYTGRAGAGTGRIGWASGDATVDAILAGYVRTPILGVA
jgi:hypothetical protein